MKAQPKSWMKQGISMVLEQNNFWVKRGSEGPYSLMQALSNGLYFTGVHHRALQQKVLDFLKNNANNFPFCRRGSQHFNQDEFFADPHASEFDELNLQLFGICFDLKVKVYSIADDILCCRPYNIKGKKSLKIFKLGENCYAALFEKSLKPDFIFMQDLVLNLIDKSLNESTPLSKQKPAGKFKNYDFEQWRAEGQVYQPSDSKSSHSFKNLSINDLQSSNSDLRSFSLVYSDDRSEYSDRAMQALGFDMSRLIRSREGPMRIEVKIDYGPAESSHPQHGFFSDSENKDKKQSDVNRSFIIPNHERDFKSKKSDAKIEGFRSMIHKENLQLNQPVPIARVENFFEVLNLADQKGKSEAKNELNLGFSQHQLVNIKHSDVLDRKNSKSSFNCNNRFPSKSQKSNLFEIFSRNSPFNPPQDQSKALIKESIDFGNNKKNFSQNHSSIQNRGFIRFSPPENEEVCQNDQMILPSEDSFSNQETSLHHLNEKEALAKSPRNLQKHRFKIPRSKELDSIITLELNSSVELHPRKKPFDNQEVVEGNLLHYDHKTNRAIIRPKNSFNLITVQIAQSSFQDCEFKVINNLERNLPVNIMITRESINRDSVWKVLNLNFRDLT